MSDLRAALRDAIVRLPEPTLGLKGGVNRGAVIDAIDEVFASTPESLDVAWKAVRGYVWPFVGDEQTRRAIEQNIAAAARFASWDES